MITRLAHICIGALDLEKTEQFYTQVLGLRKAFDFRKGPARFGFYIEVGGGTFLEAFQQAEPFRGDQPGLRHICLEVDSIDATIAQIKAAGWPIGEKKLGADQSWQVWLKDPNGHAIELHEYTPESSQRTGATVIVNW